MSEESCTFRGKVVTPDGVLEDGLVETKGGLIKQVRETNPSIDSVPASHAWILPGLIDIHNHGAVGYGYPTAPLEGCRKAALYHRSLGSTTQLASLVSARPEVMRERVDTLKALVEEGVIYGIHFEGPFISVARKGAQDPDAISGGNTKLLAELAERGEGAVRSITFAPETEHARDLVDVCAEYGIIVSFGHSDSDYKTATELIHYAAARGVSISATHLFNGMPPMHHRSPGIAAAMLDAAKAGLLTVELIADGVHLDDNTVDMVTDLVDPYTAAVTDSMAATGKEDGQYVLGALPVTVRNGVARLTTTDGSQGSIAGGTSTLCDQLKRRVDAGNDIAHAIRMFSAGPARVLRAWNRGELVAGKRADLFIADEDFNPLEVWVGGQRVSASENK